MSENQNKNQKDNTETASPQAASSDAKKIVFGTLTPLTTAQIITLLVGSTSSNSSYGGY